MPFCLPRFSSIFGTRKLKMSENGMARMYSQIMLFGDSITQFSFDPFNRGFGAALANVYQRKADVLNRGFSGYNTDWAIPILKQLLPTTTVPAAPIILLTIFFGANDAALPFSSQHVPLARYASNLRTLISLTTDSSSPWYNPSTKVLLISPPPLHEPTWADRRRQDGQPLDRKAKVTAEYAKIAKEVGRQAGVPVVDLWGEIMSRVDDGEEINVCLASNNDSGLDLTNAEKCSVDNGSVLAPLGHKLMDYLSDGLHLSAFGNEFLYGLILAKIREHFPDIDPNRLPQVLPWWRDIDIHNLEASLQLNIN